MEAADKGIALIGFWGETTENRPGEGIDPQLAPSEFEWDEATNEVICPLGKRLVHIRIHPTEGNGAVHAYAAAREDCKACEKRKLCTPNNKMPKHGRRVRLRLEDDRVDAFLARLKSPARSLCGASDAHHNANLPTAKPIAWILHRMPKRRLETAEITRILPRAQPGAILSQLPAPDSPR